MDVAEMTTEELKKLIMNCLVEFEKLKEEAKNPIADQQYFEKLH